MPHGHKHRWRMPEEGRMCVRFWCAERGEYLCCRDCPVSGTCANMCQNHPETCGLSREFLEEGPVRRLGRKSNAEGSYANDLAQDADETKRLDEEFSGIPEDERVHVGDRVMRLFNARGTFLSWGTVTLIDCKGRWHMVESGPLRECFPGLRRDG